MRNPSLAAWAILSLLIHVARAEVQPSTSGFYPIWENTAAVVPHQHIYLGSDGAHFGIGDRAQIGVQPLSFIYRTPNVYGKLNLGQFGHWDFATQLSGYYLFRDASRAFFSPMYASRIDNEGFSIFLAPISGIATWRPNGWFQLHHTLTLLGVASSGAIESEGSLGYTAVAEFQARQFHSVLLHAGEVGFKQRELSMLGISYRYQNDWMQLRAGYFYRLRAGALQSSPLVSFGVNL